MDVIQETFKRNPDAMRSFGQRLLHQFAQNEAYRRPKELEWLEDLRQFKGIYDPSVKIEKGNSKVYPKLTRSKVNIVLSRLHEMLFPETERNWEIEPTPDPSVPVEAVRGIAVNLIKKDPQTGTVVMPTTQELKIAVMNYCKERCESMTAVIDDQLTEMDYAEETKKVLRSALIYGTGILKGPMIAERAKRIWEPADTTGDFKETKRKEEIPYYAWVRLWDWYPDMSTTDIDKIEGSFERHLLTKHDLRQLMKRDDFYPEMIEEFMRIHTTGNYVPRNWEVDLQMIEVEASMGREGLTLWTGATNTTQPQNATAYQMGKKYQLLEYWGYVDGSDLEACGIEVDDISLEYLANVWLLNEYPVKAVLFDAALDQYKVFYYEKDETSIFGEGLPRIMRHSQTAVSAAARMVLDNGACVAGPQMEMNVALLAPDTDYNSFYARKLWYREGRGIEANYPAIRELNFDSHIDDFLKIIDTFQQFADVETTLPTWMISQMVNNETAQATSGRMSMINISIKDVVKNFDTFNEKVLRDLYRWNMEYSDRLDIKGDYNVKSRGVSSLVMKEIRMQALTNLSATLQPDEWLYIPRRELLQEKLRAHDINIKLRTEEEAQKLRDLQENSKMKQLMYAQIEAQIEKDKAQALVNLTKAKDKNIEATQKAQTVPEGQNPELSQAEVDKERAKIDDIKQKTALATQKHGMEMEKRSQEMRHADAKTKTDIALQAHKHHKDVEIKEKMAEHAMKVKERVATIKAKQKPKEKKGGNK